MKVRKYPLVPDRIRRPPREGWSWIDRRFFREYSPRLHQHAILLYVFLVSVGDKDGLSYYGDSNIANRILIPEFAVGTARDELVAEDLVAFEFPLYQVLALPHRPEARASSEPTPVVDIMRELVDRRDDAHSDRDQRGGR